MWRSLLSFFMLLTAVISSTLALYALPTTNTSYIIVTSDVIIPGSELLIDLHLLNLRKPRSRKFESDECVLDLSVSSDDKVWHHSFWKIELDKTPKNFNTVLKVLVPAGVSVRDKRLSTNLKIESNACIDFSHSVEIPIGKKKLLASLRTDKLKYHPGEFVMIESLIFTQALKPYSKPVNISIHNAEDVVLVEWLDVAAKGGLLRKEYFVPLLARSEELILTLESKEQVFKSTFKVERPSGTYEKESFLLDVRAPKYFTLHSVDESRSPGLDISVTASHHSGTPLEGRVEVEMFLKERRKSGSLPPLELVSGHKEFSLKPEEIKQILGMKVEELLVGHEIRVSVKVGEVRPHVDRNYDTDQKEREGKKELIVYVTRDVLVTFVDQSHVLFFSEFTPQFFKPGLTYFGQVLLRPVDEVFQLSAEKKEVSVKVKHYSSYLEGSSEEKFTLRLKPNSFGTFLFNVSNEDNRLELEAQFEDKESGKVVKAHLEVLQFSSKSNSKHFLQIMQNQQSPKVLVGERLQVNVELTFPTSEVFYQVFCQSVLVISGKFVASSPATKHDLSLVLPQNVSHLLSSPRLVVEALSPSNEIISDSLQFAVEQKQESQLEVLVKSEVAEPGEMIELLVKAEPLTTVTLLSVSEVLVFDPNLQERRKLMACKKITKYLRHLNSLPFSRKIDEIDQPFVTFPSLAPDSQRVYNESGSLLLSDGYLFVDTTKQWPSAFSKNGTLDNLKPAVSENLEWKTWKVAIGSSGEEKLSLVLPEEARLYTIAAFGIRPGKGLVVVDKPIQLLSSFKVLSSLTHPKSVIRGEEFDMTLHLFNNKDTKTEVEISLTEIFEGKPKFGQFFLNPKEMRKEQVLIKNVAQRIKDRVTYEFEIISSGAHHKLNSSVELKYQGYEVVVSESLVLDNFNGLQVLDLDVPKNIANPIKNSERAHVKIYGHPLGPAIEHVCQSNKKSSILEERTKMWFILAVNVLEHISNNSLFDYSVHVNEKKLPVNISFGVQMGKEECIKSIRDSLQYLLNEINSDGSFSFYPRPPGYIWLTSLMLDSTVLLRKVMSWHDDHVEMVRWLAKQQRRDGSFVEDIRAVVLRSEVDDNSYHVPLTSQVVASLFAASNIVDFPEEIAELVESVTKRSVEYIQKVILKGNLDKDSYSLNLAAFALTLARSDFVFDVLRRRDKLMVHEGNEKYWKVEEDISVEESSISIESTSYAILTSLAMNDLNSARPFVNFLLRAMKPGGVFVSSQDSHVALKALSQYFRLYNDYHEHEHVNVDVKVTLSDKKQLSLKVLSPFFVGSLYFDHSNISLISSLRVESSGEGAPLVQSIFEFNKNIPKGSASLDLEITVDNKDRDHLEVEVCAINKKKMPSGLLIGEVPLLSGYELNLERQDGGSNPQVLKQGDEVYLVFDEVKPWRSSCANLFLERFHIVSRLAPRFIKLYPCTEPARAVYKPYAGDKIE